MSSIFAMELPVQTFAFILLFIVISTILSCLKSRPVIKVDCRSRRDRRIAKLGQRKLWKKAFKKHARNWEVKRKRLKQHISMRASGSVFVILGIFFNAYRLLLLGSRI